MPLSDAESRTYLAWYQSTHIATPTYGHAIDQALDNYHTTFHETDDATALLLETSSLAWHRFTKAVLEHLNDSNNLINRWPLPVRCDINRRCSSTYTTDEAGPAPFHAWAQPRFLERRKQAASVYFNLLHFLVYNWSEYGGINNALHSLGLEPNHECCDIIDDLRLYIMLPQKFKPRSATFTGRVAAFFLCVLRDPEPTPRTNPLLWWIAVLIHSELNNPKPRPPVHGIDDKLDLSAKLEALDHYARVLIFHRTFVKFIRTQSILQSLPEWKLEVVSWVEAADVSWVSQDRETPQELQEPDINSKGWLEFRNSLREAVDAWLVIETPGPMHEILSLQEATVPPTRDVHCLPPLTAESRFVVHYEGVQEWSHNPHVLEGSSGTHKKTYSSVRAANKAILRLVVRTLKTEIEFEDEDEEEDLNLKRLHKIFSLSSRDHRDRNMVVHWDTSEQADGLLASRVIYVNEIAEVDDVKATAWAERQR